MPPWIGDVLRYVFGAAGIAIAWKLAWAVRGWVESQRMRAENEAKILGAIESFSKSMSNLAELINQGIEEQRETNKQIWTAVQLHAARLNDLERPGDKG